MKNKTFMSKFKNVNVQEDKFFNIADFDSKKISTNVDKNYFTSLPKEYQPLLDFEVDGHQYIIGNPKKSDQEIEEQGYVIDISEDGLLIKSSDKEGFEYGIDTFTQLLDKSINNKLNIMKIYDYPTLKKRGLMLDISRGKVYTLEYLLNLVDVLKKLRYNVFQLYTEHTFEFKSHPEISKGSSPITAEDIKTLQNKCNENGIELQANLQSLGHMNRILTRPEYMELTESDMFWSLDTSSPKSYKLLEDMYKEYLPLFDSPWLNVCSDEPYDLGRGKSSSLNQEVGELYFNHLLKLHDLAAKYDKKIMIFGDVVKEFPEYADRLPKDIIYIDWIYDPKEKYGTPELFEKTGMPYWVSPGTGNWNTLFPRLDGSITNIVNLTVEGIKHGAQGMLLTDWNDHGGYAQPAPSYYSYAYAAAVSWMGMDPGKEVVDELIDETLDVENFSEIIHKFGSIYNIKPIWSKNRSQCVMALFDEPIFGKSITGQVPPNDLIANDLDLPDGIEHVFERHSEHPLRPFFSIPKDSRDKISKIIEAIKPLIESLEDGDIKDQFVYIADAFELIVDKLELGIKVIDEMETKDLSINDFILLEDEIRILIKRYTKLQIDFTSIWFNVAKISEIEIFLTNFANIISRLDYLRDWLSIQREEFDEKGVDWEFSTYNTADYTTIPTY